MPFVQPIDLALVLQSAQNYTKNKLEREDRDFAQAEHARKLDLARKQQEMQVKIRQAQARVLQARQPDARQQALGDLQAMDPTTALATQEKLGEIESQRVRTEEAQRKSAGDTQLQTAQAMKQSLEAYQNNPTPETLNREIMRLSSLGRGKIIDVDPQMLLQFKATPPAPGTPRFQEMMRGFDDTISMLGDPEKRQRYNAEIEQQAGKVSNMLAGAGTPDPKALDPTYAMQKFPDMWAKAGEQLAQEKLGLASAAGTRFTARIQMPGTTEPTRQVETDLQQKSLMLNDVANLIDVIKEDMTPESFTYLGRGEAWLSDKLQQAGVSLTPETRKRVEEQQALASDATFMTYQLIVAWSGKAVTDRERKLLFDAIGDPQRMGYSRYKSALGALKKMAKTSDIAKRKALRFGVDTTLSESERQLIDSKIQAIEQRRQSGEIDDEQALAKMQKVGTMFETRVRLSQRRAKAGKAAAPSRDRLERLRALRDSGASEYEIAEALKEM